MQENCDCTNDSAQHWNSVTENVLINHFPLHRACRDGDVENLHNIIDNFPNQNSTGFRGILAEDTFYGWTPIHYAAYFGRLACLRKLLTLQTYISPEVKTSRFGQTPCHLASFGGTIECLKWLLDSGASVFEKDYLGETPAHKAARSGSIECLNLLIAHGSNLSCQNNAGQTPLDVAELCNQKECANYLRQMQMLQYKRGLLQRNEIYLGTKEAGVFSSDSTNGTQCTAPIVAMGYYGYQSLANNVTDGPVVADVTMDNGVSVNAIPVAGRKRVRNFEDDGCCNGKRLKVNGDCFGSAATFQEQLNVNIAPVAKAFGCYF